MKRVNLRYLHRVIVFVFLVIINTSCRGPISDGMLIHNIDVVSSDQEKGLTNQNVVIQKGKITYIGTKLPPIAISKDSVIDGTGKYLAPGFIDGHVHLFQIPGMNPKIAKNNPEIRDAFWEQMPKSYLYYGFTTLIELGPNYAIDKVKSLPIHPDIYHCDNPLTLANGYGMTFDVGDERYEDHPNFLYDIRQKEDIPAQYDPANHTPEEAVKRVASHEGRVVKVHYEDGFGGIFNWPTPTETMIKEVVEEAKKYSLPVALHANSLKGYQFGLKTKVDILAHGLWHWGTLDNSQTLPVQVTRVLDSLILAKTYFMPTMQVIYSEKKALEGNFLQDYELKKTIPKLLIDWYNTPAADWYLEELNNLYDSNTDFISKKLQMTTDDVKNHKLKIIEIYKKQIDATVSYLAQNNASILFGSDTPSSPSMTNPVGYSGYLEIHHLYDNGLTLKQLFDALTINNAKAFNLEDVGTIELGKKANLLILNKNPLETIEAYNGIEMVILNGTAYSRDIFRADLY